MQTEEYVEVARNTIIDVCRKTYERGYICGLEGNFSIRIDNGTVLTTPRSTCKDRISAHDLVLTDMEGNAIGEGRPSTELKMHLIAYKLRDDIKAVVHAHPTTAVAFTVAGLELEDNLLPEVVCTLGSIPVAPYATPSTDEVPRSIEPYLKDNDAILLDHHGALCLGTDLWDAFYKLETLEHYAQTLFTAIMLGGTKKLKNEKVKELVALRQFYKS
jgi:L-fuculose-phosphate aldolase